MLHTNAARSSHGLIKLAELVRLIVFEAKCHPQFRDRCGFESCIDNLGRLEDALGQLALYQDAMRSVFLTDTGDTSPKFISLLRTHLHIFAELDMNVVNAKVDRHASVKH